VALVIGGAAACLLALVASAAAFAGLKFAGRVGGGAGSSILNIFRPDPPNCVMGEPLPELPPDAPGNVPPGGAQPAHPEGGR
jgi:hypothetical protein